MQSEISFGLVAKGTNKVYNEVCSAKNNKENIERDRDLFNVVIGFLVLHFLDLFGVVISRTFCKFDPKKLTEKVE